MTADSQSRRYLAALLEARTGQQIAVNRIWRVEIALKPLMRARGIATLDQLVAAMIGRADPALTENVVDALLNNETSFFRDLASFGQLQTVGIERLRSVRARRLRIWSAGCSTGQEAYTLAMIFANAPERWGDWIIDILATDVSGSAIARAREGLFSKFEIQRGLPIRNMLRWFDEENGSWRVKPELARRISFQQQNLLDELPVFGRFDIILCRNVLLYLSTERRREAFNRLAASIAPDGCLMLGAGETVMGQTSAFRSDQDQRGLFIPAIAQEQSGTGLSKVQSRAPVA